MILSGDGVVVVDGGRPSGKWHASDPETLVIDWNCRSDLSSLRKNSFQLVRTTNVWVQLGVDQDHQSILIEVRRPPLPPPADV